jgi:flagellar protein FlgJ
MTSPILQTDVYTDFQGLSGLRARAKDNSEETLREVAGQFEALFIQMMLKSMRDANLGEGLMDSDHTKTYQSMFDKQIAIDLSKRQGLGLTEMLVQQLGRSTDIEPGNSGVAPPVSPTFQALAASTERVSPLGRIAEKSVSAEMADWEPDSPESFLKELWPHAQRTARELGTKPEVLLAQAALETGWGKHMIRGIDGRNSFNLFSIKADASWQGERAVTDTVEFRDGLMRKERATFRAYPSLADSFADYAEFLKANPRYRDALKAGSDLPAFAQALSEAGYATDPEYSSKINTIMNSERLQEAVSGIKEAHTEPLS